MEKIIEFISKCKTLKKLDTVKKKIAKLPKNEQKEPLDAMFIRALQIVDEQTKLLGKGKKII